jgi:hypothetical protein
MPIHRRRHRQTARQHSTQAASGEWVGVTSRRNRDSTRCRKIGGAPYACPTTPLRGRDEGRVDARHGWAAVLAVPLLAGCMSNAPVAVPPAASSVAAPTPTPSSTVSSPPNRGAMTQDEVDNYTLDRICKWGMEVVTRGGYSTLEPSAACQARSEAQAKKEKGKRPSWKTPSSGACGEYRGEGPYGFVLSDGTSRQEYGLTCREALRQAKRSLPPGVFVVEVIPL